jgi:hypothetical protein
LVLACFVIYSQKYQHFYADFSIKQKSTKEDKYNLIVGNIDFDNKLNKAIYNIHFPQKEKWIIQDSFVYKYKNDTLTQTSKVGIVNDYLFFKQIIEHKDNDFGLTQYGFMSVAVEETEDHISMEWEPPSQFKTFLKKAYTQVKDNLLTGVIFIDNNGVEINKTYYDNYEIVNDLPVPMKISSHYIAEKEELFKTITLRKVRLEQ